MTKYAIIVFLILGCQTMMADTCLAKVSG